MSEVNGELGCGDYLQKRLSPVRLNGERKPKAMDNRGIPAARIAARSVSLVLFLSVNLLSEPNSAGPPPDGSRLVQQTVTVTEYEWWLLSWSDSELMCTAQVEHLGWPSYDDLYKLCGKDVYAAWAATSICAAATNGGDTKDCAGLYLVYRGPRQVQREVTVQLPGASITVSLSGCESAARDGPCHARPTMHLEGKEPLEGQRITEIRVKREGREFSYAGATVDIPLSQTSARGADLVFWAVSSYGDSSPAASANYRLLTTEDKTGWYVNVLSQQWSGAPTLAFSVEWQAFPPAQAPQWLSQAQREEDLATEEPYQYLAGNLISLGLANATLCQDRGLLWNGGVYPERIEWARQAGSKR